MAAGRNEKPMTDIGASLLIKEVDDEVRAERLQEWWKRFGNWLIGAAIVMVLATIGYELWQSHKHQANEEATTVLIRGETLVAQDEADEAAELLSGTKGNGGVDALAKLRAGQLLLADGKTDAAKALFEKVAAQKTTFPALASYATLYIDQANGAMGTALTAKPNDAFYTTARELEAIRLASDGKPREAANILKTLLENPQLSATQRDRLTQMKDHLLP